MVNLETIPLNPREKELFALLYACGEPVEEERLAQTMELNLPGVQRLLDSFSQWLDRMEMPVRLVRMGSQVQLCTREEYAAPIRRVLEIRRGTPLSPVSYTHLDVYKRQQRSRLLGKRPPRRGQRRKHPPGKHPPRRREGQKKPKGLPPPRIVQLPNREEEG